MIATLLTGRDTTYVGIPTLPRGWAEVSREEGQSFDGEDYSGEWVSFAGPVIAEDDRWITLEIEGLPRAYNLGQPSEDGWIDSSLWRVIGRGR